MGPNGARHPCTSRSLEDGADLKKLHASKCTTDPGIHGAPGRPPAVPGPAMIPSQATGLPTPPRNDCDARPIAVDSTASPVTHAARYRSRTPGRPPDRRTPLQGQITQPTGLPEDTPLTASGRPPDPSSSSTGAPPSTRQRSRSARPVSTSSVELAQGRPPYNRVRLRVNGAALDPSHSFGFYRGIYWCWRCQGVASSKPRALAKTCTTLHRPAKLNPAVSQLRNRVPPSNIKQYGWPLPEGSLPHPGLAITANGNI